MKETGCRHFNDFILSKRDSDSFYEVEDINDMVKSLRLHFIYSGVYVEESRRRGEELIETHIWWRNEDNVPPRKRHEFIYNIPVSYSLLLNVYNSIRKYNVEDKFFNFTGQSV